MSANPSSSGGSVGGGAGSCSSGGGGPCGACKFLRRKCVPGCIFAPYFDSEQGAAHFAAVHKVFGASNVSKLLLHIPVHKRLDAVVTICYEAQARLRDPVYGCVAHIFALQQQEAVPDIDHRKGVSKHPYPFHTSSEGLDGIRNGTYGKEEKMYGVHAASGAGIKEMVVNLQAELSYLQAHLATLELPSPPPPPPPSTTLMAPPPLSISDLPSASSVPATYDLSSLFDPVVQHSWGMQQRQIDPRQFGGSGSSSLTGSGDLQALARELLHRQGSPQHGCLPCTDASPSQSLSK
ncbi:LOB domain-containing protein 18, putative [Theobroma cacao]|uniref:LOB domain-containing protein 18, putative n=1 Tax=Theobroma cacao TaxID=3641 RepID=A0A061E1T5_THECC|nr:LOB domain-containing protein 18, putative [Theobroma cacao]